MKCPKCVEAGKKSSVYSHGGHTTTMDGEQYWDEDGKWHDHDPNEVTDEYSCTLDHHFSVKTVRGCKVCGIKDTVTIV